MSKTICEEKRRLLETYQKATQTFADGVEKLRLRMGTMDKAEYDGRFIA